MQDAPAAGGGAQGEENVDIEMGDEQKQQEKQSNLSQEKKQDIQDAFAVFDKENTNSIPQDKLRFILRALSVNPTETQYQQILAEISPASKPSLITLEQLMQIMEKKSKDTDTIEQLIEALKVFDNDKDGKLTLRELRFAMTNLGDSMTEEEVDQMVKQATSDDQFIVIEDFAKIMMGK